MTDEPLPNGRSGQDREAVDRFLDSPSEQSFEELFQACRPQLVAFFRSRRCEFSLAEDLAQEVMLVVYCKARQLRDRRSFRGWLFKIALNAMRRHYGNNKAHAVETVDLATVRNRLVTHENHKPADTPAFEFLRWMALLDSRESEVMKLRYIEQWEYHEIASAQGIPIGTVQWRIFNAKKKLAPYLSPSHEGIRNACNSRKRHLNSRRQYGPVSRSGTRLDPHAVEERRLPINRPEIGGARVGDTAFG